MSISRREFLKMGLAGGLALAIPFGASACSSSGSGSTGTLLQSKAKLPAPFRVPLPVPPVLEPVRSDRGADYYELTQKAGESEILPGLKTEVWCYDGQFPGPTIESRSGRRVVVRHQNELPVPVSTHLHGGTIMGTGAADSVVNSYGQCHELANLYVAGPSIFPTEGASNPTYTILAISLRGAEQLAAKWSTVAG